MKQQSILAQNIRRIRLIKGLTQASLGELSGLSSMAISQIENGTRWPRKDTLSKLAAVLEVDVNDLLSGEKIKVRVAAEDLSLTDAILVLEKLSTVEPWHRSLILGLLFEDRTYLPAKSQDQLKVVLDAFSKAQ